ncbi:MAG: rhomboid family intramembrane serine protease [Planctomycetales bacterium]|nr:rhomboid family intramembrane serine protease [bacterium]UNM09114.1 MAG: rhomboid family intramembrane serine protease [Planctomycetales bacterium]
MAIPLRDNAPKGAEPVVTPAIIGVCVLVFGLQCLHPGGIEGSCMQWGEIPARIFAGELVPGTGLSAWWTVLTSMFMHGGLAHIIGNMVVLWLFGDNVEWLMGRARFLLFYILSGIGASLVTIWLGSESSLPGVGASGAIAGVMAAYLIFYPRARITSLMWIDPFSLGHAWTGSWGFVTRNISALWFIGSWIVFQLLLATLFIGSETWLNLGIYAHAAGAITGALICWPLVIEKRRPAADHPVYTDSISAAVFGDEGDAGGSSVPVQRLGALVQELREEQRMPEPETFSDPVALDMVQAGKLEQALRHCRDMLEINMQQGNRGRARGYERLIDELQDTLALRDRRQQERSQRTEAAPVPAWQSGNAGLERRIASRRRELLSRSRAQDPWPD